MKPDYTIVNIGFGGYYEKDISIIDDSVLAHGL